MKKYLSFLLALFIIFSLSACESETPKETVSKNEVVEVVETPTPTSTPTQTPTPTPTPISLKDLKVHFLDVGQADSIFVELPNNESMLIDAGKNGSGSTVVSYIKGLGFTTIDYLIGTHPHEDHIGGLDDVINSLKINNIYMMDIELLTEPVKYQRRQYYRLELNIPVRYMQITETESNMMANGEELPERLGNLSEFYSGDTIDLSGGGLRFTGDGFVEKGNKIAIVFDIDYEGNIERYVLAAVVMSFAVPQHHGMYEHRVEFRNISKENREMLIKYIFQEERKIRKNNR